MTELITSRRNDNIVRLKKLISSKRFRRENGEFVCEGKKLLREALMWNAEITSVFACGDLEWDIPQGAKRFAVSRELLEYASSQKTPQDVIFTCKIKPAEKPLSMTRGNIILENIQDPGNVGTALRSAAAFGVDTVILAGDCADPYSVKSVRASMGAVFHSNIVEMAMVELGQCRENGMKIFGASLSDRSKSVEDVGLAGVTVAIGNEGGGLSAQMLELCDEEIIIPIAEGCESLNAAAAAAIIMWEMSKANR